MQIFLRRFSGFLKIRDFVLRDCEHDRARLGVGWGARCAARVPAHERGSDARKCTVLHGFGRTPRNSKSSAARAASQNLSKVPVLAVAAVPQREYARGLAVYDPRTSWARHHGSDEHGRTNERASERGELHMTERPAHPAGARHASAHAKALAINLDPTSYGTFAEIG